MYFGNSMTQARIDVSAGFIHAKANSTLLLSGLFLNFLLV